MAVLWAITQPSPTHAYSFDDDKGIRHIVEFNNQTTTAHVVVVSNIDKETAQWYASLCEAFLVDVDQHFVPIAGKFPLIVVIFPDKEACSKFLLENFDVKDDLYGIFLPNQNMMVSYDGAGIGTFTHEIFHKVEADSLPDLEPWAEEGLAAFFEKGYGYWQGDSIVEHWGYENPWRLKELGSNLTKYRLKDILSYQPTATTDPPESELRLAATFLYAEGKLKRYLDLAHRQDRRGYSTYFEAAFEAPLGKIEPRWEQYLAVVSQHRSALINLPDSDIMDTQAEYRKFAVENKLDALNDITLLQSSMARRHR